MADDADSKQPQDKAWWDAWRLADFTWAGLAKRALAGWVVRDGVLMEEESGAVYGAAAASDEPPSAASGLLGGNRCPAAIALRLEALRRRGENSDATGLLAGGSRDRAAAAR